MDTGLEMGKSNNFNALILAGGVGTRLWPKSRLFRPKQFLRFDGEETFLSKTVKRVEKIYDKGHIWILCKPYQLEQLKRDIPDFPGENIIIEPAPKGTCAATIYGSLVIEKRFPGTTVTVFPSDHLIRDEERFSMLISAGQRLASTENAIIIYGIRPERAETSYGYIEMGATIGKELGFDYMAVRGFHEKPDKLTARAYYESKRFLWNSGMFSFSVKNIKRLLKHEEFGIWASLIPIANKSTLQDLSDLSSLSKENDKEYEKLPPDPFDTAFLEKIVSCKPYQGDQFIKLFVFPCDFEWHDMGVWESFYRISPKDEAGNVILGKSFGLDCKTSLLMSEDGTLVAAIGMKDMIVVCEKDAVLVCPRDKLDRIKELVEDIREKGFKDYT